MRSILPSLHGQGLVHTYKLCGHNIAVDAGSGCVHSVDDDTYEIIRNKDESRFSDDIKKLISDGKLFAADNFEHIADMQASGGTPLKALCLNVSHACNMSCAYCFAQTAKRFPQFGERNTGDRNTWERNTGDSPRIAENALMPFDTGKQAVDFLIENSGSLKTLDIDFFGGEPLLNRDIIKELVAYARMAEKFTGKKFRFTLTTNGLLIDDDIIDFTSKQFHNVVLSLDGRPDVNDKMRKLPADSGGHSENQSSYSEVLPKIRKLVEARRGKGYYIRGTFTRENMDFVKDILHLADDLGFTELSLEPAVTRRGSPLGFTEGDLPELFNQYEMLAVEMKRRKERTAYVRPEDIPEGEKPFNFYHFNLNIDNSPCIYKRIAGCGAGTAYLAVTPGGDLYPCHQFIGDVDYKIGDVWQGITNKALHSEFAKTNIYTRSECRACWARFYCSGGCAANAYHDTGSINSVYSLGCELFKKRIECAIMLKF